MTLVLLEQAEKEFSKSAGYYESKEAAPVAKGDWVCRDAPPREVALTFAEFPQTFFR